MTDRPEAAAERIAEKRGDAFAYVGGSSRTSHHRPTDWAANFLVGDRLVLVKIDEPKFAEAGVIPRTGMQIVADVNFKAEVPKDLDPQNIREVK